MTYGQAVKLAVRRRQQRSKLSGAEKTLFAWSSGVLLIQIVVNMVRAAYSAIGMGPFGADALVLSVSVVPALWLFVPFTGGVASLGDEVNSFRLYMLRSPLTVRRKTLGALVEMISSPVSIVTFALTAASLLTMGLIGEIRGLSIVILFHLAGFSMALMVYQLIFSNIRVGPMRALLSLGPRLLIICLTVANHQLYPTDAGLVVEVFGIRSVISDPLLINGSTSRLSFAATLVALFATIGSLSLFMFGSRTGASRMPPTRTRRSSSLVTGSVRLAAPFGGLIASMAGSGLVIVAHGSRAVVPDPWVSMALVLLACLVFSYPTLNILFPLRPAVQRLGIISPENPRVWRWMRPGMIIRASVAAIPPLFASLVTIPGTGVGRMAFAIALAFAWIWTIGEVVSVFFDGSDQYNLMMVGIALALGVGSHFVNGLIDMPASAAITALGCATALAIRGRAIRAALKRLGEKYADEPVDKH